MITNMELSISMIKTGNRYREVDQEAVKRLAASIKEVGLIHPIMVDKDYNLLSGAHRLAAYKLLGKMKIEVRVNDVDTVRAELVELYDNLMVNPLTKVEIREHLLRCKELHEILHPETKAECNAVKTNAPRAVDSFAKDAAKSTGKSERFIQEEIQIAKNVIPEIQQKMVENKVTKKDELKVARAPVEQQEQVLNDILTTPKEKPIQKQPEPTVVETQMSLPIDNTKELALQSELDEMKKKYNDLAKKAIALQERYTELYKKSEKDINDGKSSLDVIAESKWAIEIVNAGYKALALKYHPDQGGTAEDFKAIKQAREDLLAY